MKQPHNISSWVWIPSLYYAQGIPYVVVMTVSVILYKRLGISNTDIALYTSWLYLPWVIKPLWSPLVDLFKTKRFWIVTLQLVIGAALAGAALAIPVPAFFQWTLAFFWLLAFASATHDIAADGFYMLGLPVREQSYFIGIRSTFYRLAIITGQGLLVMLAGFLKVFTDEKQAWSIAFLLLAGLFLVFFVYHRWVLPRPVEDRPGLLQGEQNLFSGFLETFRSFFQKPNLFSALAFLLLYRLGEAQLVKMTSPFLMDNREHGGLGLTTSQVGLIYGVLGVIALSFGGILGGWVVSKKGLKFWMVPMILAINVPNLVYVYLSYASQPNLWIIMGAVALEQFGYGFGFTAYMLFMIYFSTGKHKTAHFALCTGFMALGMMLPGMVSGWLQEIIGYRNFFVWVLFCTLPGFVTLGFLKLDSSFGIQESQKEQDT